MNNDRGLNENVNTLVAFITGATLNDDHWKMFGYKRRPKIGSFFKKFQSREKTLTRDFLIKELFLLATIDVLEATKNSKLQTDNKFLYIYGVLEKIYPALHQSNLFVSIQEYISFIEQGLTDYADNKFPVVFAQRLEKLTGMRQSKEGKQIIGGAIVIASVSNQSLGLILDRSMIISKLVDPSHDEILDVIDKDQLPLYHQFIKTYLTQTHVN